MQKILIKKLFDYLLFHEVSCDPNNKEFNLTSKRANTDTHNGSHYENQMAQRGPHPAT